MGVMPLIVTVPCERSTRRKFPKSQILALAVRLFFVSSTLGDLRSRCTRLWLRKCSIPLAMSLAHLSAATHEIIRRFLR